MPSQKNQKSRSLCVRHTQAQLRMPESRCNIREGYRGLSNETLTDAVVIYQPIYWLLQQITKHLNQRLTTAAQRPAANKMFVNFSYFSPSTFSGWKRFGRRWRCLSSSRTTRWSAARCCLCTTRPTPTCGWSTSPKRRVCRRDWRSTTRRAGWSATTRTATWSASTICCPSSSRCSSNNSTSRERESTAEKQSERTHHTRDLEFAAPGKGALVGACAWPPTRRLRCWTHACLPPPVRERTEAFAWAKAGIHFAWMRFFANMRQTEIFLRLRFLVWTTSWESLSIHTLIILFAIFIKNSTHIC